MGDSAALNPGNRKAIESACGLWIPQPREVLSCEACPGHVHGGAAAARRPLGGGDPWRQEGRDFLAAPRRRAEWHCAAYRRPRGSLEKLRRKELAIADKSSSVVALLLCARAIDY